ncbi:MAG TPA: YafY family protein [Blastocatellia bacterium]|nr:YafY family protein [Blastocatellia bacterium]
MRANRLLAILIRLQVRGRLTAQELADEFEVSIRTIYRDIDELSASGVPVYADRGPGGGFQLLEGYRTTLTGLTAGEAEAILLVGLPGPAADLGLAKPLAMARFKLLAAISPAAGKTVTRIGDRLHLDPVGWYKRAAAPVHLPAIAEAVWGEKRLSIRYESWSAVVHRKIDPLGLVLKAGDWYLIARAGRDIRTYKVTKVLDLQTLSESFDYPAGFDLGSHWQSSLTRFEADLRKDEATVRVSPAALGQLDRLGAAMAETIMEAQPDSSGWRQATVPIEGVNHAAGLLLGFADDIEVLGPPALRNRLAERARQVVALYDHGGGNF